MIDEKKLIDELNGWSILDKEMNELVLLCIDTFKRMINKQPKVGEWISVKERLPEDNQAVLTCKNKQISILIWKAEKRKWLEPKGNWWWSYCMVEKWQPLPEPYKGD